MENGDEHIIIFHNGETYREELYDEFSEKSKTHGVSIFDILTKYRQKTYN